MCYWGLGCCGPPPWATIKAYNNTSPWALNWYDLKGSLVARECTIDAWPSATPPIAVVSSGTGAPEEVLLVRDASDGSRHEDSSSSPLRPPNCSAGKTGMVTDNSTILWLADWIGTIFGSGFATRMAAFNSSLAQQCQVDLSFLMNSMGRSGTSLNVGSHQNTGLIARQYSSAGSLTASLSGTSLSSGGSQVAAYTSRDGSTMMAWGISGGRRRNWRISPLIMSFVELTAMNGAVTTQSSIPATTSDIGKGDRLTSTHFAAQYTSSLIVVVQVATCLELWTLATGETFVAIDATNVYTISTSTKVLTARAVGTGTTNWTLDLTGTIAPSSATFGKFLSGGFLAVLTPTSPVAIVNVSTGALVTSIDVGGYDIVERDNRYIVVGPKRTTAT